MLGLESVSLARKLPTALLLSALTVSLGVGLASFQIASSALRSEAADKLQMMASERAGKLDDLLQSTVADLATTATLLTTVQAARDFANAWTQIPDDPGATLRAYYVEQNPNPEDLSLFDSDGVGGAYNGMHARYHPSFRSQVQSNAYADLYFIDPEGHVVYSVGKNEVFAKSVAGLSNGLGRAFVAASQSSATGVHFEDFEIGDSGEVSGYFSTPVFASSGRLVAVLVVEVGPSFLSTVVSDRSGLGDGGEVLVVGGDHRLRSESSQTPDTDAMRVEVRDERIFNSPVPLETSSYRGEEMLYASKPSKGSIASWSVAAVTPTSEIFA